MVGPALASDALSRSGSCDISALGTAAAIVEKRVFPVSQNPSVRQAFRSGAREFAPIILGVISFGAIAGIAAVDAGLTVAQPIGMSIIVLAGRLPTCHH